MLNFPIINISRLITADLFTYLQMIMLTNSHGNYHVEHLHLQSVICARPQPKHRKVCNNDASVDESKSKKERVSNNHPNYSKQKISNANSCHTACATPNHLVLNILQFNQ